MNIALTGSIETYLDDISRFPVLTPEEEFRLAERYYKTRDLDAAHRLVTSNLRYVVRIALEYRNYGVRLADLVQEGNMGLMVAVKKFNPYKGFRLITYATWWIRAYIQEFILKTRGLVKRSSRALKKKLFYRKDSEAALREGELEVTTNDLSLDSALDEGSSGTTHLDMLKARGPVLEDAVAEREEQAIVKGKINGALAVLNEKERLIVEKRVMADNPMSLQGLGDELGLTRERVRQIEKAALEKLKKNLQKTRLSLPAMTGG